MAEGSSLDLAAREIAALAARLRGAEGGIADGIDFAGVRAAHWRQGALGGRLTPRGHLDGIALSDLLGVDRQKTRLLANTEQFVAGLPANNALLWGARGTGKSSLVHAMLNHFAADGLRLVEVERQALHGLPDVVDRLAREQQRFLVFCDDLSFEPDDASYKALKSVLDGSVFATTDNVLIYATSNRRHLMPEKRSENLEMTHTADGEVHPGETTEEKVSLSDRFGLWVSFQPFPQTQYLDVARHWVSRLAAQHHVDVPFDDAARTEALRWALGRGNRSGRVANHFARHWVGQQALARG